MQLPNEENLLGRSINSSEENQNIGIEKDQDNYPDLGSDQVFPFVAGLDSYQ